LIRQDGCQSQFPKRQKNPLTRPSVPFHKPARGDRLFKDGKEVGYVTSAIATLKANIALGYVRREVNLVGTELKLQTGTGETVARIVEVPFGK